MKEALRMASTAPETFTLEIPKLADWLNLNQQLHWAPRNKRAQAWRHGAHIYARKHQLPKGLVRVKIDIYVWKSTRRRYDPHNLMPTMKHVIDGLVDYGLIPDDNTRHLDGPHPHHGGYGRERLVVVIQPLVGACNTN